MSDVLLRVDGLSVGYDGRALLPPVSFAVRPDELWAVMGPNGSGKTTLLRTVLGLLAPVAGRFRWSEGVRVGYVSQRVGLDLSVPARAIDVVRGGLDRGWSFLNPLGLFGSREAVRRAMADTNTESLARRQLVNLSEGQKQRVLVARALACDPQVLVLDEPSSSLDTASERALLALLDALRAHRGVSVLLVNHHLDVALARASHLVLLDAEKQIALSGPMAEVAEDDACSDWYCESIRRAVRAGQAEERA